MNARQCGECVYHIDFLGVPPAERVPCGTKIRHVCSFSGGDIIPISKIMKCRLANKGVGGVDFSVKTVRRNGV